MQVSNIEYIALRLVRRMLFRYSALLRHGKFVPYFRPNLNQAAPMFVAGEYLRLAGLAGIPLGGRRILEIGVGRTNSTCYALAASIEGASIVAFEPFAGFSDDEDRRLLAQIASDAGTTAEFLASRVMRVSSTADLPAGCIDAVFSYSVLEHVAKPKELFKEIARLTKPNVPTIHVIDYRDHFFKYPYHFLQFKKSTWNAWLNPGDLPAWRLYDHMDLLEAQGLKVQVIEQFRDDRAFAAIRAFISPDYRKDDPRLAVERACILAWRS